MIDGASVIPAVDGKPLLLAGLTIISIPFSLGPRTKLGTETPRAFRGFREARSGSRELRGAGRCEA